MADNKSGAFIGGMFLGIAIGAVTGLLAAPKTGKETRKVLKKTADALPELMEDLSSGIQLQAGQLSETALQNLEDTLVRLQAALEAGRAAGQQELEQLQTSNSQSHRKESPTGRE